MISDQQVVSEKMTFYINIAKRIGINNTAQVNDDHPSIKQIREKKNQNQTFEFKTIREKQVPTYIKKTLSKTKASKVDSIPPKIVKVAMPSLTLPIFNIANTMLSKETLSSQLKKAKLMPIYKKMTLSFQKKSPSVVGDYVLRLCLGTFGPRQANLVLIAYASSEGSGEPAHPRSLARTFAARSYKQ